MADWQSRLRLSVELDGDWRVDRYRAGLCIVKDAKLQFRVLTFNDYQSMIVYCASAHKEYPAESTEVSGLSLLRYASEQTGRQKTDSRSFVMDVDGDLQSVIDHHRTKHALPIYCTDVEDAVSTIEKYVENLETALTKPGAKTVTNKRYDLFCMRIEKETFISPHAQQRMTRLLQKAHQLRFSFLFLATHPTEVPKSIRDQMQWQLFVGQELTKFAEEELEYKILDVSQRFIPFGVTLDKNREENYLWNTYPLRARTIEERKHMDKRKKQEAKEYYNFLNELVDEED